MTGMLTLFRKEVLRFWKVGFQTIATPALTALLYLLIFGHAFQDHVKVYGKLNYASFLVPGLVMMSILQNAFANTSSSLIQSKVTGNLIFVLLTPLSYLELFCAYVFAAVVRGFIVGASVLVITVFFVPTDFAAPLWIFIFGFLSAIILGILGLIAGIWAERFDQLAAFQNFIIIPATFLAGVFYSIYSLPSVWLTISHFNPFFYMVDGFRYGFLGISDVPPMISLGIVIMTCILLSTLALALLRRGYKLRS